MRNFQISKYNPIFRTKKGLYLKNEWTSISDISNIFDEGILTVSDYLEVEDNYISALKLILLEINIKQLKIVGLEKHDCFLIKEEFISYNDKDDDLYNNLIEGAVLQLYDSLRLIRLIIREKIWCYFPAIGRFGKIDRFAEKYVNNSPYSFTAGNPILFREIKGDSLEINGTKKARKEFEEIVEDNLGGLYDVIRNKDTGLITLKRNSKEGKLNTGQEEFLDIMNGVIDNKKTTSFEVLAKGDFGTDKVIFGDNGENDELSYKSGTHVIDLGDINAFPNIGKGVVSSGGILSHELHEGFDIQVGKIDHNVAHRNAFGINARVDGLRIPSTPKTNSSSTQVEIPVFTRNANNKPVRVIIKANLKNNDIIKIFNNEKK